MDTTLDFIPTAFRAPQIPSGYLARPRLRHLLASARGRVVLICAPAGFGKSVATTEWLQHEGRPYAWLSLDMLDNDPQRFASRLSRAVAARCALNTPGAASGGARTGGIDSGPTRDVVSHFRVLDPNSVLVLDDVHILEAEPVLGTLRRLTEAATGGGPRLVLLSRVDPPLGLGRLRLDGDLAEFRERDLRFTPEEAAEFFRITVPGGLDPALLAQLDRRTEGWPAGLRMAALALQHAENPRAMVEAFTGSHRIVVDYLLTEALGSQPEEVQRFLMETSILGRFTEGGCTVVTENAGAPALLRQVEEANLFLVPLGEDRRWYRYHHLFSELLQFRLRRLHPERLDALHERASRWFEEQGELTEALEHASRMSDRARLAELLDHHGFDLLSRSETANLARWLRQVPDADAFECPNLQAARAWICILTERAPDLEPRLRAIEAALDRVPHEYERERRRFTRVQLDLLRAFEARFSLRLDEALEIGSSTLATLPASAVEPRGVLLYNQARVRMLQGEMAAAAECLSQSFAENLRAENYYLALTSLALTGSVLVQTEGLAAAREALSAAVAFVEERQLDRVPAFANILVQLAHVHLLGDDMEEAEGWVDRANALAGSGSLPETRANGLVVAARLRAAQGRLSEAAALLWELAVVRHDHSALLLDTTPELERMRLAQLSGTPAVGAPLRPAETVTCGWTVIRETESVLSLWRTVREADHGRGHEVASRLLAESERRGRALPLCTAKLGLALLSSGEERWRRLSEALCLAAERGYVRPLIEGGEPVRALLHAGLARSLPPAVQAHARLLLERFARTWPPSTANPAASLAAPLTGREREVLRHLLRGLSNKAMARSMFVSAETVKTHLKRMYAKLGVTSRQEAAARARELGLEQV